MKSIREEAFRVYSMTGEAIHTSKKCNRVVVGLKLNSSGRELLTWTLAKITHAGDQLTALHVTSSQAQADALKGKLDAANQHVDAILNSEIGAYEGFCSIKEVDLEIKVICGCSLKRELIKEAKSRHASKLVLGIASRQLSLLSFPLAKYCAKRLPETCSVLVIQDGRVVFEKEGAIKAGDNGKGVLNKVQKSIRSQSWKGPSCHHHHHPQREDIRNQSWKGPSGHHHHPQREGMRDIMFQHLDGKRASTFQTRNLGGDALHDRFCSCPLQNRVEELPACQKYVPSQVQVSERTCDMGEYHAFKYVASQVQGLERPGDLKLPDSDRRPLHVQAEKLEPRTFDSICTTRRQEQSKAVLGNSDGQGQLLREFYAFSESDSYMQSEHILKGEAGSDHLADVGIEGINSLRGDEDTKFHCRLTKSVASPAGWPLLHRSISMCTSNSFNPRPRRLSVVEWALQLPDRPKEIFRQPAELAHTNRPYCTPGNYSDELHPKVKQHRHEEMVCKENRDDSSLCKISRTMLMAERLCQAKSCRKFEFLQLKAATNNFSLGNLVGKGGCSEVYRGILNDGCLVAVKCLNPSLPDSEQVFATEIEIISSVRHNHIVQLIGYYVDKEHYMLVYNLATEGNLEQKLHAVKGNDVLSWDARHKVAVGVAEALNYLHDKCVQPVIHRDVKSSNILLLADLQPQLTDFGLAKWASTSSAQITCSDVVGTFGYLAPEYFMFGKVNEKTDVYSFGVVLLELITGRRPIDTGNPKGQENLVYWAKPLLEVEANSIQLIDPKLEGAYNESQLKRMMVIAALCLRQSPHSRPRMCRILELLTAKLENPDLIARQDLSCKETDEGYEVPDCGDHDIRKHLTLALLGLNDDGASQGSIDHSMNFAHSNNYLEEYLGGRYSRSGSFD